VANAPAALVDISVAARGTRAGAGALGQLLSTLGQLLSWGATTWIVSELYLGRPATAVDGLLHAARRVWTLFVFNFVIGLLTILGMIFFILPGVLALGGLSVGVQVILLERHGDLNGAITRSLALTRDRRILQAGYVLLAVGAVFAVILAVSIAGYFVVSMAGLDPTGTGGGPQGAVEALLQALLVQATLPFVPCLLTVVYYDLRVRREGFDLEVLATRMGVAGA
jgi:hypothetical protein